MATSTGCTSSRRSRRKQRELISAGLFFYPVLQAADILAYRADEVPVGDDQRQHIELMRDIAERFNERFGETLVIPRHRIPEVGARIMDLQSPDQKMSTTAASEQGTVYVLDDEAAIVKKFKSAVTDSGKEVVRAPDKPGISNLIEVLAVDPRSLAGRGREASSRARDTGRSSRPSARRWRSTWRPCASATRSCAATRRHSSARWQTAPSARGQSPVRCSPTSAQRWASGRADRGARYPRRRMSLAQLDLDLEVFQGPFDLLLTLVLREEIDLLEVELAQVVVAYLDHLEQTGELDLEAATEFLVLIAALLELKSRLMLTRDDGEADLEPAEAAEELLARMLEYRRYRSGASFLHERLADESGFRYRSAPLPPELRRVSVELAEAVLLADPARCRAGRPAAHAAACRAAAHVESERDDRAAPRPSASAAH